MSSPAQAQQLDLTDPLAIHLIGIGGPGINPLASILAAMGHRVSGSDLKESAGLDRLRAEGVTVFPTNAAENIGDVAVVGRSTAVPDHNVEVRAARERGLPVLSRADVLSAICDHKRTLAVGGTHGKTTTTAMLAVALEEARLDPSYLVGGDVNEIGSGAVWNHDGEWFVVEADESDGTFLRLGGEAVIVTNIELDHLDHFGDIEVLTAGFEEFCVAAPHLRMLCADDPVTAELARRVDGVTYGTSAEADYRITDIGRDGVASTFVVEGPAGLRVPVHLPVPGVHNVRNATAALATTVALGGDPDAAARGLGRFAGVARRFEFRGDAAGVTMVDDYAHLATEVQAAIEAAAGLDHERVVAVFQQHRYRRIEWFWEDLSRSFDAADVVVIVEPYPGFEETPAPGISGRLVSDAVAERRPGVPVFYAADRDDLRRRLLDVLRPGDLCLVMQAGGALTDFPEELLPALERRDG